MIKIKNISNKQSYSNNKFRHKKKKKKKIPRNLNKKLKN